MDEKSSIILSLVIHILIFQFIILTFTLKPVAHKPIFIFLGSILDEEDTSPVSEQRKRTPSYTTRRKVFVHSPSTFLPDYNSAMIKPQYHSSVPKTDKEFIKNSFLNTDNPEEHLLLMKNLGVSPSSPVYRPLHLDPK